MASTRRYSKEQFARRGDEIELAQILPAAVEPRAAPAAAVKLAAQALRPRPSQGRGERQVLVR